MSQRHSLQRSAGAVLVLALALLLFGCAAPLRKPEVNVASVEFVELGVVEQTLLLRLCVTNPNAVELNINSLAFSLEVNARAFAHGVSTSAVRVAAQGEALVEIRTVTRLGEIVRVLRQVRRGDAPLAYHLSGRVDVAGYGQLPFERSAELPRSTFERFISH